MRTVSVSRAGKGDAPAPSVTVRTLRAAVGLAKALQHLELPDKGSRVRDVEAGAHLARQADHPRCRIIEEPEALGAVVRHDCRGLLEIDICTCKKALVYRGISLERASESRPLLVR